VDDAVIDNLATRLKQLEHQNRLLRRLGGCLVVALSVALWVSQATSRSTSVEAERFTIKDEHGKVRAVLGVGTVLAEGKDAVGLRLLGRDGTTRVQVLLRGNDDAPFVQLRDREEKVSAQMDMGADGTPGFALWGPRTGLGVPRAEISMSFRDPASPFVRLLSKDDKVLWKAP